MKTERFGKYKLNILSLINILIILILGVSTPFTETMNAQIAESSGSTEVIIWNGTKVINDEITIKEDQILKIEPGTIIHLYQSSYDAKQLIVKGTLIANGTTEKPIYFIGHPSNFKGITEGDSSYTGAITNRPKIEFYNDVSSKSIICNAVITNSCIDIIGSSMKILNSTITNDSTISITNACSPTIDGNDISDNGVENKATPWYRPPYQEGSWSTVGGMGIYCYYGTTAIISNNTITHNACIGLWIQSASPIVKNNIFSENRWCGIKIEDCWSGHSCKPVIMNNVIKDHGLALELADPPNGYSVMPRLYPVGVDIEDSEAFFYNNIFINNEVGIANYEKFKGSPELRNDTFINNTIGVYSYCSSPVFWDCYFDNMIYDFYIEPYSHVKAYNTTFNEDKLYITEEAKLETENKLFYPMAGGIGLIGILLCALILATEVGKYKLFAFLFPMYTRIKQERVLDQFVRGQIYGLIRAQPGIHYSNIRQILKVGNGALAYHLSVLEKEEFIKSKSTKLRKLFFPTELPAKFKAVSAKFPKGDAVTEGIKLSELQERIVEIIIAKPGITQTDITSHLNIPKQTVSYNINNLVKSDVIETTKDGNKTKCFIK